mgnify:CR=1 FL=1
MVHGRPQAQQLSVARHPSPPSLSTFECLQQPLLRQILVRLFVKHVAFRVLELFLELGLPGVFLRARHELGVQCLGVCDQRDVVEVSEMLKRGKNTHELSVK